MNCVLLHFIKFISCPLVSNSHAIITIYPLLRALILQFFTQFMLFLELFQLVCYLFSEIFIFFIHEHSCSFSLLLFSFHVFSLFIFFNGSHVCNSLAFEQLFAARISNQLYGLFEFSPFYLCLFSLYHFYRS